MNTFAITANTTCDLPLSYTAEHGIDLIPLHYEVDGILYGEGLELEPREFYEKMRNGSMPTTNACIPETAREVFLKYVKQGIPVLHIAFSSGLSSSYSNCVLAANDIKEEYPDAEIVVLDSLCASLGEGLLVHYAVEKRKMGMSFSETVSWVTENMKNVCHMIMVDDLFHLHRGGRVSKTSAIVGSLINVKPIIHLNDEGRLIPIDKIRGRKKALAELVNRMEKQAAGFENPVVTIGHGDALEDAEYVAGLIRERFGIDHIIINTICPTIGAHTGAGIVALFFMGGSR